MNYVLKRSQVKPIRSFYIILFKYLLIYNYKSNIITKIMGYVVILFLLERALYKFYILLYITFLIVCFSIVTYYCNLLLLLSLQFVLLN